MVEYNEAKYWVSPYFDPNWFQIYLGFPLDDKDDHGRPPMGYEQTFTFRDSGGLANLTGELVPSSGPSGILINAGFVALGGNELLWSYSGFQSNFLGAVRIARSGTTLAAFAVMGPATIGRSVVFRSEGPGFPLAVSAQYVDPQGNLLDSPNTSGFVDLGNGWQMWTESVTKATFQGAIQFVDSGGAVIAASAIRPMIGGPVGLGPIVAGDRRDDVLMEDIIERLKASGVFDAIGFGPPWEVPIDAQMQRVAWVARQNWSETDRASPITRQRDVSIKIWVEARSHNKANSYRELERLEAVVQNVVNGQSLGGFTEIPFTHVARGRDSLGLARPNSLVEMDLMARYRTSGYGGHPETDRNN